MNEERKIKSARVLVEFEDGDVEEYEGLVGILFDSEELISFEQFPKWLRIGHVEQLVKMLRASARDIDARLKQAKRNAKVNTKAS